MKYKETKPTNAHQILRIKYCNMIHKSSKNYQEAPLHDQEKLTLLDAYMP